MQQAAPGTTWLIELMVADMTARGWLQVDLAQRAFRPAEGDAKAQAAAQMRVSRFLNGKRQTPRTAKAIARALGHPVDRYMGTREREAVAS